MGDEGSRLAATILGAKEEKVAEGFKTAFDAASKLCRNWTSHLLPGRGRSSLSGRVDLGSSCSSYKLSTVGGTKSAWRCWLPDPAFSGLLLVTAHASLSSFQTFADNLLLAGVSFSIPFVFVGLWHFILWLSFQWYFMRAEIKHKFKPHYSIIPTHSSLWNVFCLYHTIPSVLSEVTKWIPCCQI